MRSVLLSLVLLMVLTLTLWPVSNPDAWTHLALGRNIAVTRCVPQTDVLSFTVADRPYVNHEWLYQLVLLGAFRLAGVTGITLLTGLALVATFLILGQITFGKGASWFAASVLALGVLSAYQRFHVRPEAFSFLFTAAFVAQLEHWRRNPHGHSLLLLPILQVLWVNMHGYFVVGVLLVMAYLIGIAALKYLPLPTLWRERHFEHDPSLRKLALVLLGVLAACFVSPYHYKAALYPLQTLISVAGESSFMVGISELLPPWAARHTMMYLSLRVFAVLLLASFLLNLRRTDPVRLILCALAAVAAVTAMRNVPFLVLVGVPSAALNFREAWEDAVATRRVGPLLKKIAWTRWVLAGALLPVLLYTCAWIISGNLKLKDVQVSRFGFGVDQLYFSTESTTFLDNHVSGKVFNNFGAGGWLAFARKAGPNAKVFIDGRAELYGKDFFDEYRQALAEPSVFEKLCDRYAIEAVCLQTSANAGRLIQTLLRSPNWRMVCQDSATVVLVRDLAKYRRLKPALGFERMMAPDVDFYDRLQKRLSFLPMRKVRLTNRLGQVQFRYMAGDYKGALAVLTEVERASEPCAYLLAMRSHVEAADGQLEAAAEHAEAALHRDDDFPEAHLRLLQLSADLGRAGKVRWVMKHARSNGRSSLRLHQEAGRFYFRRKLFGDSATEFARALKLRPRSGPCHVELGAALLAADDVQEARECFRKALEIDSLLESAREGLGRALLKLGQLNKASETFRKLSEAENTQQQARGYLGLGKTCEAMGKPDEAKRAYEAALKLDGNLQEARQGLKRLKAKR